MSPSFIFEKWSFWGFFLVCFVFKLCCFVDFKRKEVKTSLVYLYKSKTLQHPLNEECIE